MLINLKVEFDECEPLEYSCEQEDIGNINWNNVIINLYDDYIMLKHEK